jgi:hypothetical protein
MNNQSVITDYYQKIDNQQISEVLDMFSFDASYERADITYNGIIDISDFFLNKRQIRGEHILDRVIPCEDHHIVIVTGQFVGTGAEGDSRTVDFADIWQFNELNKIKKRKTYLALGYEYVER